MVQQSVNHATCGISLCAVVTKIVRVSPHTSFLETDSNRNSFTHHGLHLNKSGKRLVTYQLASLLQLTFEQRTSAPLILGWHNVIQDNKISNCAGEQEISLIRNSSHNKRTPITRSDDFLWQIQRPIKQLYITPLMLMTRTILFYLKTFV